MDPSPHLHHLRVYYEDTDAAGIVYHATYLAYAERARTEAMRALGIPHAEMDKIYRRLFVVRRVNLEYLRPARLDDWLTIITRAASIGAATAKLRQEVRRGDETLARLDVSLVCIHRDTWHPARIPEPFRLVMARNLAPKEDEVGSGS